MDHYFTIEKTAVNEFKDRGSRFIALACQVRDTETFKKKLQEVRKEHPKAVHHCFAYRIGTDGNQFRVSDDGEPSGTAGKPILGQIDSRKLTDTAIIVTRYFGGTLLGVPGLINAYKTSASLVLQTIPIIQKPILIEYQLQFDYTQMNDVMQVVRQFQCQVLRQESPLFSQMTLGIPLAMLAPVLKRLNELRNVELTKILP